MKRTIAIFLLISIFLLAGCSNFSAPSTDSTHSIMADEVELAWRTEDYDEYLNYMGDYIREGKSLSESFVMADRLFVFGSWKFFALEWTGAPEKSEEGQWYRYILTHNSDVELHVVICHQPERYTFREMVKAEYIQKSRLTKNDYANSETMVKLPPREKSFYIDRNGVRYLYVQGHLQAIEIEVNGILIHCSAPDPYGFTRIDHDSVLGRLLSLDEDIAKEAYNEIKASLTK